MTKEEAWRKGPVIRWEYYTHEGYYPTAFGSVEEAETAPPNKDADPREPAIITTVVVDNVFGRFLEVFVEGEPTVMGPIKTASEQKSLVEALKTLAQARGGIDR